MVTLSHVHADDWQAVRECDLPEHDRLALLADLCRIDCLYMIRRAGSGHLGSSFSSMDIVSWVFRDALLTGSGQYPMYFSSKGHDVPGLYTVLIACGVLGPERLHQLRRLGGLPGHPDVGTPGMLANCGSLGMGISKAKGMIEAWRLQGASRQVVVMTGDGELQEGQIWESLGGAVNRGLSELRVVVDHNKIQSDTLVERVSDLGDLPAKFAAFGWNVQRCDGHSIDELAAAFAALDAKDGPGVVIADTVKGHGVSFMEGLADGEDLYHYHSGAPSLDDYERALDEIRDRIEHSLGTAVKLRLEPVEVELPPTPAADVERLVPAYTEALQALARRDDRIVALDGDLVLDTGLIPFAEEFPDRFVECGIAEQDMVGQAGGMALAGMLPVVHSFSCFLTTRPAEQIATNASERTKILYVGSLAGVLPGGPGHSHQSVRDVALMSSVPGMTAVEPSCAAEVKPLLEHLAGPDVTGPGYLRLVTVPVTVPYSLPENYVARPGRGWIVREGSGPVVLGSGPVVLAGLCRAAEILSGEHGVDISIVAMPWLNEIDVQWLHEVLEGHIHVVTVENHLVVGGLAASVRGALDAIPGYRFHSVGLTAFPVCGQNDEVLAHHGLDPQSLSRTLLRAHSGLR